MAKHRLKTHSALGVAARRAVVIGAVSAGTVGLAAAPSAADSIAVDGIGSFDVPDGVQVPDLTQAVDDVSDLAADAGLPDVPDVNVTHGSGSTGQEGSAISAIRSAGQRALHAAESKLGAPYVWGASGPEAFDCSGLVQWAYAQAGVQLPRTTYSQEAAGEPVSMDDLQPGDVVFYNGGNHAGIYAGDGQIIHASTSGTPVKYAPLHLMRTSAARRM